MPQRNEGSPRDSKGTQSPRPLTQQSPKLCLFLGKPSQISILAPQVLWRQAWDCLLVSIVTRNREPPAAVWGYHRHQYLQVHTCPENPWDGAASSLPPCTCISIQHAYSGLSMHVPLQIHQYSGIRRYMHSDPAWARPSTNGTGDHLAGCDPLPQLPSPPWCRKVLRKEKILFTTPTATQLTDHMLRFACGISCSSHRTTG